MIEFTDVSYSYPVRDGTNEVLKQISFQVKKGEKLGIIGKNGSGKSTLCDLFQVLKFLIQDA